MMFDSKPFLILEGDGNEAVSYFASQLGLSGLRVIRTFDLQATRHDLVECTCPDHGTDQCDCQIVVMLIYGHDYKPVSIVAHSCDGRTWFSLVDTAQQRADPYLVRVIHQALPQMYG